MVVQDRPERCLPVHSDCSMSSEIPSIPVVRRYFPVRLPSIWSRIRAKSLHKNNETSSGSSEMHRDSSGDLSGQHSVDEPRSTRIDHGQGHHTVSTPESWVCDKLAEIKFGPITKL